MNANLSTTSDWLAKATQELEIQGVPTARLDCLVLLEDATGKDRSYILAHPETELDAKIIQTLDKQVERRALHEPLAYIRGKSEFYGREFIVNEHVLQPRPESETMIELLIALELPKTPHISDVGTGSGALGITAALEIPGSTIELMDIDPACLAVARKNLELYKVTGQLAESNLLEHIARKPDVILANLPYVPDTHTINEAAMFEPKLAIFGGVDGLDHYRQMFQQIEKFGTKPRYILTESLPFQHHALAIIARKNGYILEKSEDFIQVFAA